MTRCTSSRRRLAQDREAARGGTQSQKRSCRRSAYCPLTRQAASFHPAPLARTASDRGFTRSHLRERLRGVSPATSKRKRRSATGPIASLPFSHRGTVSGATPIRRASSTPDRSRCARRNPDLGANQPVALPGDVPGEQVTEAGWAWGSRLRSHRTWDTAGPRPAEQDAGQLRVRAVLTGRYHHFAAFGALQILADRFSLQTVTTFALTSERNVMTK